MHRCWCVTAVAAICRRRPTRILDAARRVIDQKMRRGAEFSSPETVKEYLRTKLAGFDHEVFAVLFLDARYRLIEYAEMFRGTIDGAEVHPREVVKEALQQRGGGDLRAQPSEESRSERCRSSPNPAAQAGAGADRRAYTGRVIVAGDKTMASSNAAGW